MRVLMMPSLEAFSNSESGIKRIIEAYTKYGKDYGIEFVQADAADEDKYDVFACHAGSSTKFPKRKPVVAHLHGLYWTADYKSASYEYSVNANVIASMRIATVVTVPSEWVARTIRRYKIDPVILPHGIDIKEWVNKRKNEGYVLWNKNRDKDVCNPYAVGVLARKFPEIQFLTTFFGDQSADRPLINIHQIGLKPHDEMKKIIQGAAVYLSTTKETFGVGILEALASGVPVLGFDYGGNSEIVQHCVNGYLAVPDNYDDLVYGLNYCLSYRDVLSHNALIRAQDFGWEKPMKILKDCYKQAFFTYKYLQREKFISEELYSVKS